MIKETIEKNEEVKVNTKEIEILRKHFPACFDKDGKFDITVFEELIKKEDVDIKKEGYSLNFLGKSYARYLSGLDSETVIVPDKENKNIESENIYIVGDNLDALQHLKYSYSEKIKCIYIDPPYNTGNDGFVYNDKFSFTAEELAKKINIEEDEAQRILDMQGRSTHSAWLAFMYPRLELAKELLSEDGVIFISIDDNEQANLKLLCDSVFGEQNFVTVIHCQLSTTQGMKVKAAQEGNIVKNGEYILCYSKSGKKDIAIQPLYDIRPDYDEHYSLFLKEDGQIVQLREIYDFSFPKDLSNKKPLRLAAAFKRSEEFADFVRSHLADIVASDKISGFDLTADLRNGEWKKVERNGKEYLLTLDKNGKMRQLLRLKDSWGKTDGFKEPEGLRKIRGDWWEGFYLDMGNVAKEGGVDYKNGKKPLRLIKQIIKMTTNKTDIILDFFSGSATTAHAVMQQNLEDGGNRKYIMVQLDEPCNEKTPTGKAAKEFLQSIGKPALISELGKERIRRAASQIKKDEPEKSKDVDLGFKTYYLQDIDTNTLDKIKEFNPDMPIDAGDIQKEFGRDTIIETWKIRDGFGFNATVEEINLSGYVAYKVSDSEVGTYLYLLDDMENESIQELVRQLESFELNIDKIIEYGYSFSYNANTALRANLKTLKNKNAVDVLIRY